MAAQTLENTGLMRRTQERVREDDPNSTRIFLHCVIRALNRQFIQLLEESEAYHTDVPYHSNVRWLSLGKVLRRVWDLRGEIGMFLENVGKASDSPELGDPVRMLDSAFAVDLMGQLNDLNLKLQGKDVFVHKLYSYLRAFRAKLTLFSRQMSNKSFFFFFFKGRKNR